MTLPKEQMQTETSLRTRQRRNLDKKEMEKLAKEGGNELPVPYTPDPRDDPMKQYGDLSFFAIRDFAIKAMKTFKNRAGWKLVVGEAQQSVEIVSDDVVIKALQANGSVSGSGTVRYCSANGNQFNFSVNTGCPNTEQSFREQTVTPNVLKILTPGIYEVEFAYGITAITDLGAIKFAIEKNGTEILKDKKEWTTPPTTESGYRKGYIKLIKGDLIEFIQQANYIGSGSFTMDAGYTYRSLRYFRSNR